MPMLEKMGYDTICDCCGKACIWSEINDNDVCDDCNAPSAAEMAHMKSLYDAEKSAGMHRPQSEINADLVDAGRGHLVRW